MALEFRTKEENYKGKKYFPDDKITVLVFTESLPQDFKTEVFCPGKKLDPLKRRERYTFKANLHIENTYILVEGIPPKDVNVPPELIKQRVDNLCFRNEGLDIFLVHDQDLYRGTVFPIEVREQHPFLASLNSNPK